MERFTNAAFSFEVTDTPAAGGDGPKGVAILLHGFPQDRRCWDRVTSTLAGCGYRVLARAGQFTIWASQEPAPSRLYRRNLARS